MYDFPEMVIDSKTCVLRFFAYYVSNAHSKKNSATYHSVQRSSMVKLEFTRDFRKPIKFEISRKSVQCEPSCSMWKDRNTDGKKNRHIVELTASFVILRKIQFIPRGKCKCAFV